MNENELSYAIRGCIFNVHNCLGPGLLELAYQATLAHELFKKELPFAIQVGLPMEYESVRMDIGYRIDLLVDDKVIIEIKSVETLLDVHHKQIITY